MLSTPQYKASPQNNGGEWDSVCAAQKKLIMKLEKKTQQQCVSSKTMAGLLWFIYRPRCELFSFKLFSPENIVPIKLFTAKSVDTQTIKACSLFISKFSLKQDNVILGKK